MKRFFLAIMCVLAFGLQSNGAQASWEGASKAIERSVEEMLAIIKTQREQSPEDVNAVVKEMEGIIDRDVDIDYISAWVMGKYYRRATQEERVRFAQVFKTTMMKTYAKSLMGFDIASYKIVPPTTQSPEPDKQIVPVDVTSAKGEVFSLVNYVVEKSGNWKLVNIVINGINLRITFKNQFADLMQQHRSVDKAISAWESHIGSQAKQE